MPEQAASAWHRGSPDEAAALVGTVAFPQGGTVELTCTTTYDGVEALDTKILAIKVGTLN
jgi:hypothetical protein